MRRNLPLARQLAGRCRGQDEPLDDLVQDASVGLLLAIDGFDPECGVPFRAYAVPSILRELNRHSRHPSVAGCEPESTRLGEALGVGDDPYALVEIKVDLAAGVRRLPHVERKALTLRLIDDLTQSEIAERLGCSQMQVSRLLARAVARLSAGAG